MRTDFRYTGFDLPSEEIGEKYTPKALKNLGYSDAFANLLTLARQSGCKYLQLDCDGIEYADLPTFDWL